MSTLPQKYDSVIVSNKQISDSGWLMQIERKDMPFKAGQCITIHGRELTEDRTYTLASGEHDEYLDVLYRYIPHGKLTPQLIQMKDGDPISFSGPFGEFTVRDPSAPLVFVATGTGVAPYRGYIRSIKDLDAYLIHGVREIQDLFCREEFEKHHYYPCVSKEAGVGFNGRATAFFPEFEIPENAHFYLCGANEMIFDMHGLLVDRGVDDSRIHTEAYYYRLHS